MAKPPISLTSESYNRNFNAGERERERERERESRRRRIRVGWREFNDSFEKWVIENVNCPLIK